jgi:hypothetical protein
LKKVFYFWFNNVNMAAGTGSGVRKDYGRGN